MDQMRLFEMAQYAEVFERIEHKVDCILRKLDALMAVKTDDTEALRAMVAAGPALVVPFEDEAEPIVVPVRSTKQRLPEDVRWLGMQARALHREADDKAKKRAAALEASKGRETKESVALLVEEQDLRTKAVSLLSEYDRARGIIRKAKNK